MRERKHEGEIEERSNEKERKDERERMKNESAAPKIDR